MPVVLDMFGPATCVCVYVCWCVCVCLVANSSCSRLKKKKHLEKCIIISILFQGEPGFLGPQGEPGLPGLPGTKVGDFSCLPSSNLVYHSMGGIFSSP